MTIVSSDVFKLVLESKWPHTDSENRLHVHSPDGYLFTVENSASDGSRFNRLVSRDASIIIRLEARLQLNIRNTVWPVLMLFTRSGINLLKVNHGALWSTLSRAGPGRFWVQCTQ